jgi:hypothetical protein
MTPRVDRERRAVVEAILGSLEGLRFGSVEIVVHDARVVHIERREKLKFQDRAPGRHGQDGPGS